MDEIRQLLSLVDGEQMPCEAVRAIAEEHLSDVRARIADLKRMERTLRELSDQCSGTDVPQCPIIDALMPL